MARLRFTILGCGSSGGVPRLADVPGGDWGACDPAQPKNRRSRCSLLVERITEGGTTRVLIDTSPDLRRQLLDAGIGTLDGVVYTHAHADHTHGIDDLRMLVINSGRPLPVWADTATASSLIDRFAYVFVQPAGSHYPPICALMGIDGDFAVPGPGGPIRFSPFPVDHGGIPTYGFRIGGAPAGSLGAEGAGLQAPGAPSQKTPGPAAAKGEAANMGTATTGAAAPEAGTTGTGSPGIGASAIGASAMSTAATGSARTGGLAYTPDVVRLTPEALAATKDLDIWILDALRRRPHPTHAHLALALEWIASARPRRAVLTNMHNDLDHAQLTAELPGGVSPAHDGLVIELED